MTNMLTPLEARLATLPRARAVVDLQELRGPLEAWRHGLSQGGVDPAPLPDGIVDAVRSLGCRRIRVFLKEHFRVYQGPGEFDWTLLDAYMGALESTGAQVVAALTMKPRSLFPVVDERVWRPNDTGQWQALVAEVVHRYSGKRGLVTHWEVGNEPNIGERGGEPYLIRDPKEYFEYYKMTADAILGADSTTKVGGPAVAGEGPEGAPEPPEPLPGFVDLCRRTGTRLDFVSWHGYNSDPEHHAASVRRVRALTAGMDPAPELFITEWNKSFPPLSVAEMDVDWGWAGSVASIAIALLDSEVDWAFYYHIWDQAVDPEKFRGILSERWVERYVEIFNMMPLRVGMFDQAGRVRVHFFVLQALGRLEGTRVAMTVSDPGVKALSARDEQSVTVLLASDPSLGHQDRIVDVTIQGGVWHWVDYELRRIDDRQGWDAGSLELVPVERRRVWTSGSFGCQVYLPAGSVAVVRVREAS